MNLNLNLDKFWECIKQWSVGRMIALLVILAWIIFTLKSLPCPSEKFLFNILLLSILLEVFQLSLNQLIKLKEADEKLQRWVYAYVAAMVLSLFGIIGFSIIFLCCLC